MLPKVLGGWEGSPKYFLYFVLLFFGTVLIYSNVLTGDFTPEDNYLITGNEFIQDIGNAGELFNLKHIFSPIPITNGARPLAVFSLMLDYHVWNLNPFGYRLTNLMLHILNVFLIFILLGELKVKREISFLSAFVYAIHPINGEVVNVPGFRSDLLVTLFFLSAFLFFIFLYRSNGIKKRLLCALPAVIFFVFALMSKETAAVFPILILILLAVGVFKGTNINFKFNIFAGFLILFSLLYVSLFWFRRYTYNVFDTFFVSISEGVKPVDSLILYLNTIAVTFFMYIRNIFVPFFLSYEYQVTISKISAASVAGMVLIFAAGACTVKARDKKLKWSLLFFIVTYLPVSNIVPLHNTISDRYMYLPLAGGIYALYRLCDCIFKSFIKNPAKVFGLRPGYIAALIVVVVLSVVSFNRNFIFSDSLRLYENAGKHAPANPRVGYNLGLAYSKNGMPGKSNEKLMETVKAHPLYSRIKIWHVIARNYYLMGDSEKSVNYLVKTALLNPSPHIIEELEYILQRSRIVEL